MDNLDYLRTEYARGKSIESYNNETKTKEEKKMKRQFFIAGVQFRPRAEINEAAKEMGVGDLLTLEAEPTNKFDPNAVKILLRYEESEDEEKYVNIFLGYVPKKFSAEVTALLSIDAPLICTVDEVNPSAKTYEMFKVTVAIPVEEDEAGEEFVSCDDEDPMRQD